MANQQIDQAIFLCILRDDVEAGNINRALGVLESISLSTARARQYRGALLFSFEGYDSDKRELYEIPEIREYFNNLAAAWPYWAWFLDSEPDMPFLPLLVSLLTPGQSAVHGNKIAWHTKPTDIALAIGDLLASVDELGDKLGLPSPLVAETKKRFLDSAQLVLGIRTESIL